MRQIDIVRRAGRSLRHAKIRTILTSLAIAVGAFTLTFSLAAGEGARQYADTLISSNVDAKSLAVAKDASFFGEGGGDGPKEYDPSQGSVSGVGANLKRISQTDIERLQQINGVASVTPLYAIAPSYVTREGQKKYALSASQYDPTIRLELAAGNVPDNKQQLAEADVLIPETFLKALSLGSAKQALGKTIIIRVDRPGGIDPSTAQSIVASEGLEGLQRLASEQGQDYALIIRGVVQKSAAAFQSPNALMISEMKAKEISDFVAKDTDDYQKYGLVTVQAGQNDDPAVVKTAIEKLGFTAKTAKDLQDILFTIVNVLQSIVAGFGVLALIASVFGIINTQYISVLERTQQIGLMKALGMRRRDVSRLFRYEAAWIGFLGGVIGAGLAWAIGSVANPKISEGLGIGAENHLLIFEPLPIAGLLLLLVVIAIISGMLPARKAAKLDPVEALRTE